MLTKLNSATSWAADVHRPFNRESLVALMRGEVPFIRLAGFAQKSECDALLQQAITEGFSPYRGVEPKIDRIGNTVFEYDTISRGAYFSDNLDKSATQQRMFAASFDPIERFMASVRKHTGYPIDVARNANGERYYAGLIRRIEDGTLYHVDFAPGEQPGWEVGRVQHQLTFNLYLRAELASGGLTHVFNRFWQPSHEPFRHGGYGYEEHVITGAEEAVFEPDCGEVVLFNTRNFHYVEKTAGERVTVSAALGLMPDGQLVLWS